MSERAEIAEEAEIAEKDDVDKVCQFCKTNLERSLYVLHESKPCCVACYEGNFSHKCEACHSMIGTDCKDLTYNEMHWHDGCFFCCLCKVYILDDQPFSIRDQEIYCAECHVKYNATKCNICQDIFEPGMKKYTYSGRQCHEKCFKCRECQSFIGVESFVLQDDYPVCVPCYENRKAKAVTQKDLSCDQCDKPLYDEIYRITEHKRQCMDCYEILHPHACWRCGKLIGNERHGHFMRVRPRVWHSVCFFCDVCGSKLHQCPFVERGGDILCLVCGKK